MTCHYKHMLAVYFRYFVYSSAQNAVRSRPLAIHHSAGSLPTGAEMKGPRVHRALRCVDCHTQPSDCNTETKLQIVQQYEVIRGKGKQRGMSGEPERGLR